MSQEDVSFTVTTAERALIFQINQRAVRYWRGRGERVEPMQFAMDVTAVHANGCPLRLEALLAANDFNFVHDLAGIYRHLDRDTGQLRDCFVPRFAVPEREAA